MLVRDTERLSICLVNHLCLYLPKHCRNRPVFWVGLPNAAQRISVFSSVSAPSATSQIGSAIFDASSKISTKRLPWLCRPANASVLCSDHGTRSMRQVRSCCGSAEKIAFTVTLNICRISSTSSRCHLASCGCVLVFSWLSVLAVTTPIVPTQVAMLQRMIHDTSADLPMPCPEATARRSAA